MRRRHRYVTVIVNGEGGQVLDMLPGRSEASLSRFFAAQGARWCRGVPGRRFRRLEAIPGGHRPPPGSRHARAGPFPRHRLVRRRAHRGEPRRAAPPTRRAHAGVRPRRVRGQVLAAAPPRPPRRRPTRPTRSHLRGAPAAARRLGRAQRAARPVPRRRQGRRTRRPRQVHRSLPDRRPARVPSHRQHAARPHAPDPRLALLCVCTPPDAPPTAASKAPTTSSKSYAAPPTASPTPTTSPPAAC